MFKFGDPKKRLYKQLKKAAADGDLPRVRELVEAGAEVNGSYGRPLFNAAYANRADCVRYLLEKGAVVDARNEVNCTALMGAAERGHADVVKMLLAAGADRHLLGVQGTSALAFASRHGHSKVILLLGAPQIERARPKSEPARANVEPARPNVEPARAQVENPEEVTFTRQLGGRVVEEIFDFAARERITLVRKEENGPVEAVTRDGFSRLEDKKRLREAFAAYVEKGGRLEENEIFPGTLVKPTPLKKPEAGK